MQDLATDFFFDSPCICLFNYYSQLNTVFLVLLGVMKTLFSREH